MAVGALGASRAMLDATVAHLRTHPLFGGTMIEVDAVRARVGRMLQRYTAARAFMLTAKASPVDKPVPSQVVMAKVVATEACVEIGAHASQVCGGRAVQRGNPIERLQRDANLFLHAGMGPDRIRDLRAAQHLGVDPFTAPPFPKEGRRPVPGTR
jgi:alkylation response protein AidB-like acyl-CoA dehydrogenase